MEYGGWSKNFGRAKRYADNVVGRRGIQAFVAAPEMECAAKGVFITTRKFSSEARNYLSKVEKEIVLIDGNTLAKIKQGLSRV